MGTLNMSSGSNSQVVRRGMASDRFRVESTLVRSLKCKNLPIDEASVRAAERNSIVNARDWGIGVSEQGLAADLHVLAMLQHHGVPTRLIDVTYNPLTALWFACSEVKHRADPGVLVGFMVSGTEADPPCSSAKPTFHNNESKRRCLPGSSVTFLRAGRHRHCHARCRHAEFPRRTSCWTHRVQEPDSLARPFDSNPVRDDHKQKHGPHGQVPAV